MKLFLIGLPGSGKSFLGKQLADELKLAFIDLDEIIEQEAGTSIAQIFATRGEAYFRTLEAAALRQQSKKPEFVMACGGGTPCFHDNMSFIKQTGTSVFINTPVSRIATRLSAAEENIRPLIAQTGNESLEERLLILLEERNHFYRQAAITLDGTVTVAEIKGLVKS